MAELLASRKAELIALRMAELLSPRVAELLAHHIAELPSSMWVSLWPRSPSTHDLLTCMPCVPHA